MGSSPIRSDLLNRIFSLANQEHIPAEQMLERWLEMSEDRLQGTADPARSPEQPPGDENAFYRQIAENMSDGILILDGKTTQVIYASPAFSRQYGRDPADTLKLDGAAIYGLMHPDDRDTIFALIFQAIAAHEKTLTYTYRGQHQDGHYIWREDHATFSYGPDGTHLQSYIISRDITERKRTEEQLRRQNTYLTSLNQITLESLNHRDMAHLLQTIVDQAALILDTTYAELMLLENDRMVVKAATANSRELLGDIAPRREAHVTWRAFDTRQVVVVDDYSNLPERRAIYDPLHAHAVACFPIVAGQECLGVLDLSRTAEGRAFTPEELQQGMLFAQLVALLLENNQLHESAARELAERKKAEESLRNSENYLRSLVESQSSYLVRTDMDGRFTYVNEAFNTRLGGGSTCCQDWIGMLVLDVMIPEDRQSALAAVNRSVEIPGHPVQMIQRSQLKDGPLIWTLWEMIALTDGNDIPIAIQSVGIDITELMAAREQLQIQENALQAAANAIVITDAQGMIEWANPAFTRLTGYTLEESIHKKTNILRSGVQKIEFYQALWNTIRSGQVWQGKLVNRRKDGTLYKEEMTIAPVRDHSGEIAHFIAIKQDITEREQAEEIRLEQERLKASLRKEQEYNAMVQRAVTALSHDARTPLSVIATAKDMLDRYFDRIDEGKRREKLDSIDKQLHYVLQLLNDMSLTVKGTMDTRPIQPKPVNLPALCQATINEIHETIGDKHQMHFVSDGQLHTARIDETLVSRILLNLLTNAVKYSPENSTIWLELAHGGNHLILRVIDQGIGISAADLPYIFDTFYRADRVREIVGSGLGLNIVKECVERHQGSISVESIEGHGSTFTVLLPLDNG